MKGSSLSAFVCRAARAVSLICLCGALTSAARAQTPEAGATQARIERARTLAVIGNFQAAAAELEAAAAESNDESARDVARILLMSVYLRQSSYRRAEELLEEGYKARNTGNATATNETATRLYFALAGQLINGVRSRLERYREFGLNYAGAELPVEARADLDQMRSLLERVADQAKEIRDDNNSRADSKTRSADAVALLEDASAARLSMARTPNDRTRWQREVAEARQHLVTSESRLASAARPAPKRAAPAEKQGDASAAASTSDAPASNTQAADSSRGLTLGETPRTPPSTSSQPANASPQQTQAGAPVNVGSLVEKATEKVQPPYPPTARTMGISGVVTVHLVVNEKGEVEAVERASGPALLQRAAMDAARRWKFRPTVVNGQPARVAGFINFNFAL